MPFSPPSAVWTPPRTEDRGGGRSSVTDGSQHSVGYTGSTATAATTTSTTTLATVDPRSMFRRFEKYGSARPLAACPVQQVRGDGGSSPRFLVATKESLALGTDSSTTYYTRLSEIDSVAVEGTALLVRGCPEVSEGTDVLVNFTAPTIDIFASPNDVAPERRERPAEELAQLIRRWKQETYRLVLPILRPEAGAGAMSRRASGMANLLAAARLADDRDDIDASLWEYPHREEWMLDIRPGSPKDKRGTHRFTDHRRRAEQAAPAGGLRGALAVVATSHVQPLLPQPQAIAGSPFASSGSDPPTPNHDLVPVSAPLLPPFLSLTPKSQPWGAGGDRGQGTPLLSAGSDSLAGPAPVPFSLTPTHQQQPVPVSSASARWGSVPQQQQPLLEDMEEREAAREMEKETSFLDSMPTPPTHAQMHARAHVHVHTVVPASPFKPPSEGAARCHGVSGDEGRRDSEGTEVHAHASSTNGAAGSFPPPPTPAESTFSVEHLHAAVTEGTQVGVSLFKDLPHTATTPDSHASPARDRVAVAEIETAPTVVTMTRGDAEVPGLTTRLSHTTCSFMGSRDSGVDAAADAVGDGVGARRQDPALSMLSYAMSHEGCSTLASGHGGGGADAHTTPATTVACEARSPPMANAQRSPSLVEGVFVGANLVPFATAAGVADVRGRSGSPSAVAKEAGRRIGTRSGGRIDSGSYRALSASPRGGCPIEEQSLPCVNPAIAGLPRALQKVFASKADFDDARWMRLVDQRTRTGQRLRRVAVVTPRALLLCDADGIAKRTLMHSDVVAVETSHRVRTPHGSPVRRGDIDDRPETSSCYVTVRPLIENKQIAFYLADDDEVGFGGDGWHADAGAGTRRGLDFGGVNASEGPLLASTATTRSSATAASAEAAAMQSFVDVLGESLRTSGMGVEVHGYSSACSVGTRGSLQATEGDSTDGPSTPKAAASAAHVSVPPPPAVSPPTGPTDSPHSARLSSALTEEHKRLVANAETMRARIATLEGKCRDATARAEVAEERLAQETVQLHKDAAGLRRSVETLQNAYTEVEARAERAEARAGAVERERDALRRQLEEVLAVQTSTVCALPCGVSPPGAAGDPAGVGPTTRAASSSACTQPSSCGSEADICEVSPLTPQSTAYRQIHAVHAPPPALPQHRTFQGCLGGGDACKSVGGAGTAPTAATTRTNPNEGSFLEIPHDVRGEDEGPLPPAGAGGRDASSAAGSNASTGSGVGLALLNPETIMAKLGQKQVQAQAGAVAGASRAREDATTDARSGSAASSSSASTINGWRRAQDAVGAGAGPPTTGPRVGVPRAANPRAVGGVAAQPPFASVPQQQQQPHPRGVHSDATTAAGSARKDRRAVAHEAANTTTTTASTSWGLSLGAAAKESSLDRDTDRDTEDWFGAGAACAPPPASSSPVSVTAPPRAYVPPVHTTPSHGACGGQGYDHGDGGADDAISPAVMFPSPSAEQPTPPAQATGAARGADAAVDAFAVELQECGLTSEERMSLMHLGVRTSRHLEFVTLSELQSSLSPASIAKLLPHFGLIAPENPDQFVLVA